MARPVDFGKLHTGSLPMEDIRIAYGGDALNEAVVLRRLGAHVELISSVGQDETGDRLVRFLEKEGISVITSHEKLTEKEAEYVDNYFRESVFPVLTPMAVDSSRPFPLPAVSP